MNNDVKTKIIAHLGSGKKNAKELAQLLKPTSKSDINKILYALLKEDTAEKHEGTPPSWTLKGRPASPSGTSERITLIIDGDSSEELKANVHRYKESADVHVVDKETDRYFPGGSDKSYRYLDSGSDSLWAAQIGFWAAKANGQLVVIATATDVEAVSLFLTSVGVNVEVCENTWEDIRVHLE